MKHAPKHQIRVPQWSPPDQASLSGSSNILPRDVVPLAIGIVGVLIVLIGTDLTGALLARTHLLSIRKTTTFLISGFELRPLRWPANGRVLAAPAFLSVLGIMALGITAAVAFLVRRYKPRDLPGFATWRELEQVASLDAGRRHAKTVRSIENADSLPTPAVGYSLGVSMAPQGVELVASFEHSLQLVAPPGSGKTLRVLAPILREHPGPVLATSTKPDLYETTAIARSRIGPVFAFDPERLCPAAAPLRWSPVAGCEDTTVAERRAAALVAAAGDSSDARGGGFFRRSAATVLACYLHAAALDGLSMREVLAWVARPHDAAPLRILSRDTDGPVDWAARLHAHTSGAAETTSGVMRTVDLSLSCFSDPAVLEWTTPPRGAEFSFEEHFSNYGTVFTLGKDRGPFGGSAPLVTAFCDELLTQAELHASKQPTRRLEPPLLACLDEAPSIAPLPQLPGLMADARGRGIVVLVAMQSFSQAEARWGQEGARTIRNAASILMVFGGLSVSSDLHELSRLCGTRKVEQLSVSEAGDRRSNTSRHLTDEPILTPATIRALDQGVALLLLGGLRPTLSYLPGLWERIDTRQPADDERRTRYANDRRRIDELEQSVDHPLKKENPNMELQ